MLKSCKMVVSRINTLSSKCKRILGKKKEITKNKIKEDQLPTYTIFHEDVINNFWERMESKNTPTLFLSVVSNNMLHEYLLTIFKTVTTKAAVVFRCFLVWQTLLWVYFLKSTQFCPGLNILIGIIRKSLQFHDFQLYSHSCWKQWSNAINYAALCVNRFEIRLYQSCR